jgi:hypothetical protein
MIGISSAHNNARLLGTLGFMDAGALPARVLVYSGVRPATGQAGEGGLLVEIPLKKPCGSVTQEALRLDLPDPALVTETGVPTWARILNGNGVLVLDCDVGAAGEMTLTADVLYAGGMVGLTSAVLS